MLSDREACRMTTVLVELRSVIGTVDGNEH